MSAIRLCALCCLGVGTAVSTACCTQPTDTTLSGHAQLKFAKKTESELIFELQNGLADTIRFQGYGSAPDHVAPDTYSLLCYSEATRTASGGGSMIKDGGERPSRIKVEPGKRIYLVIATDQFQQYLGQSCTLDLILENDSRIKSQEFVP